LGNIRNLAFSSLGSSQRFQPGYNALGFNGSDDKEDIVKHLFSTAVLALSLVACASQDRGQEVGSTTSHSDSGDEAALMDPEQEKAALHKEDPLGSYGEPMQAEVFGSIGELLAQAEANEGKVVRVSGIVTHVCPMRGCWVDIAEESGETIQIKVVDGAIVFPLSAQGHTADVEGTLVKLTFTGEEAKAYRAHLAEERGEEFDPETAAKGPLVIWRIDGRGAVISD
jgi:hypothetical protein